RYDLWFGLLVAATAVVVARRPRPSGFECAVLASALVLALARVRLIPIFAVTAAPVVARRLWPALGGARALPALVGAMGLAAPVPVALAPGAPLGGGWDRANLPWAALEFLAGHRPHGPVFNFLPFGGALALRQLPVFIDGRTVRLYPVEFVAAY